MAKAIRRNDAVKLLGVTRRNRPYLMMSTALQATVAVVISFPAAALSPNAQPQGGAVVAGNIAIGQTASSTTVNQTTQQGIIQWQQFNVGSRQSVQYNVPNAASSTLNRVVGPNPSQIAGKISSNGQVVIENQSGVMFLDGAQINTNGLMVTAIGISNQNYLAGKMVFDQGGNPNAKVVNQGTITIAGAGLAAFVAPAVRNSGTINAKMGNVVLAGAQAVTLDMYGDGLVSVNVTKQVTQTPDGVTSLVTNDGVIRAAGGTVQLTAAAADGVVQNLVSAGGRISARSVGAKTGTVSIDGIGGNIEITGQLSAEGIAAGTTGGTIAMTATGNVALKNTAVANASGKAGGGTISIGTMPDRTQVATNTRIASGATVRADATDKGNGGKVVVLSGKATSMAGSISAKGGPNGGNGGFVEVSGNTGFSLTGKVDVSARKGTQGTILIDPMDLDIVASGANDGIKTASGIAVAAPDQNTNQTVSASVLTALSGSLTIEASRNLTVDAALLFSNQTSGNSVTLLAGKNLTVNQSIATAGGDLTLKAAVSTDGVTAFSHYDGTGALTIAAAVGSGSTGNVVLVGGTGGVALGANVASGKTVTITSGGTIGQTAGSIAATALAVTSATDVTLLGANAIGTLAASVTTANAGFSFNNTAGSLTVGTVGALKGITTNNGNVSLKTTTSGDIAMSQAIGAGTGTLTLTSAGLISQTAAGTIVAAALTGSAVGAITLQQNNTISALGAIDATGIALTSQTALSIGAKLNASGALLVQAQGATSDLTVQSGGTAIGSAVTLAADRSLIIAAGASVGKTGGTVSLSSFSSNVTEATTGTIVAGTLASSAGFATGGTLLGTANAIASIGSIALAGGDFALVNTGSVGVTGPLTGAGTVSISSGTIGVTGTLSATTLAGLTAGAGGIAFGTGHIVTASTVDVSATGGGIAQTGIGTISASAILQSGAGVTGTVALLGTTNSIAAIGGLKVTGGDFQLASKSQLTVIGNLIADGNIFLRNTNAVSTVSVGAAGQINAGTAKLASVQADTFSIASGGTVTGATFELAPSTNATAVTLGTAGYLVDATGIGASTIRIGAVTLGGTLQAPTASSITFASNFGVGTLGLAVQASGAVVDGGKIVTASTLSGSAASLSFSGAKIGTIGSFAASGASGFVLGNGGLAGLLTVAGPLTAAAGPITISNAATIAVTGSIVANTVLTLSAGAGGIALNAGHVLSGATVDLSAGGGGITQVASGTITAGTLQSSAGAVGTVNLAGTKNAVSALQGFTVSAGDFTLASTGSLSVAGTVAAQNISILSGTVGIGGLLNAGTALALGASAGGITQSGSLIVGTTLSSVGTILGGATLTGTNTFPTIGTFSVGSGTLALSSGGNIAIAGPVVASGNATILGTGATSAVTVNGTVSGDATAGLVTIGGGSGGVSLANGHLLSAKTVELFANGGTVSQPSNTTGKIVAGKLQSTGTATTGFGILGTLNTIGSTGNILLGKGGSLLISDPGAMVLGGSIAIDSGTISIVSGGPLSLTGTVDLSSGGTSAGSLSLKSGGSIADGGTGFLNVRQLKIVTTGAGNVSLTNVNNKIGTVGDVSLNSGSLSVVVDPILVLTGTQTAAALFYKVAVAGDGIQLGDGATPATLTATGGGRITLIGDTFTQNPGGGANKLITTGVVEIAPLSTNVAMSIGGTTNAVQIDSTLLGNISAGTLIAGSYLSGGTTVTASGVLLDGNFASAGIGTLRIATLGTVHQSSGSVVVGSLAINAVNAVDLTGANAIGTIAAAISGSGKGFALNNTATGLTVDTAAGMTGISTNNGAVSLTTTTSGSQTINQNISVGTGAVTLVSAATIGQTGGVITAGTLIGSSVGGASLTKANAIANLGSFSNATSGLLTVTANQALATTGSVSSAGDLTLTTTTGALTLGADVVAASGIVSLISAGTIAQNAGIVSAATLIGSSVGGTSLTKANTVANLGSFANTTSGLLAFTNNQALATTGSVSSAGDLTLKTTTGALTLGANVVAASGTVSLISAGTIAQSGGIIGATTLIGSSVGGASLTKANMVTNLGSFANTTSGLLTFNNNQALATTGSVSSTGNLTLATTTGGLTLGADVVAASGTVTLTSAGTIAQSGGIIAATTLTGSSVGGASLTKANTVANLGAFANTTSGLLTFTNNQSLATTGALSSAGNLTLTTTIGGLSLGANAAASTGTIALNSAGTIGQTAGSLTAVALTGTAGGNVDLSNTNSIGTLLAFGVTSGNFKLVDGGSLAVAGTVGAANISLNAGTIGIAGFLNAGTTVALGASAGGITESGSIAAGTLVSIGTIAGDASLNGTNTIATVGGFALTGTATLKDSVAVTLAGIFAGAAATIGVPSLTIASGGVLNVGSIAITTSAGGVVETGTGQIVTNSISIVTAGAGDVSLTNQNNQILASNGIQVGNGNLIFVDDPTLTLTGAFTGKNLFFQVTQAGDTIAIGAASAATLTAASGGRISIVADRITENAASTITAASGTVEIAPFSTTVAVSLAGATQLVVDSTLLSEISTGTLTIGRYTDVTNANTPTTTAKNISLDGAVNLTSVAGTLNLQTLGSIVEPVGPLTVSVLTGSAVAGATFAIATNSIGTLTGFSASKLQLVNSGALVLAGTNTVGTGVFDIGTTSGGVTEAAGATLNAGTLTSTGGVASSVSLAGTANTIGTISGFTITSGDLTVVDNQALALAGLVSVGSGHKVDITTNVGGLTQVNIGTLNAGTLTSTGGVASTVSLAGTANTIGTITGFTITSGDLTVVDNQALALAGLVSVGSGHKVDITTNVGGLTQVNTGTLNAGTLTSTGGVASTVSLAGTANTIGTIGGFTITSGDLTVVDNQALALAGLVSVGSGHKVDITTNVGGLTQINTGTLNAGTLTSTGGVASTVSLAGTANTIGTIGGFTITSGDLTVVDNQALALAGLVSVGSGHKVDITTNVGGLTQINTGTLNAGTLTSTGGVASTVSLAGTANTIGTITGFTITSGDLTVVDNQALALAGLVSVGSGHKVDITTNVGGLTQVNTGTLNAGTLTSTGGVASTVSLAGTANTIGTITGFTITSGDLTVVDNQALALAAKVSVGGGHTVDLTTLVGGITQAASGTLIAGTLTSAGNIPAAMSLKGTANQIGTLSNLTASGGLTIVDSMALTLANRVSGGTNVVDLTTTAGGISQAANGVLIAGTLTSAGGLAGTTALLGTNNQIASIATLVVASGNLTVNDAVNLTIATNGKLSAHQIVVTDVGMAISVANGAQILTDGVARPDGTILRDNLPTSTSNTNGGAYFTAASFTQSGLLNAGNLNGAANILRIDTTGATQLDPATGLNGPNTWLIMGLTNGAIAGGVINVKALDVTYTGALGSASLSGTINNLTGQGAAGAAHIEPAANANYKMNACAVSSVNCVLLPSQGIPQHNPTSEIVFGVPYIPSVDDNQDIVVPLVTDTNDTITISNNTDENRNRGRSGQ